MDLLKTLPLKLRRQRPIGPYIVDFYCAQAKLVVEVDRDSHFTPKGQAHDVERTTYLERRGLHILRFSNGEVMESLEGVYRQIKQALEEKTPL